MAGMMTKFLSVSAVVSAVMSAGFAWAVGDGYNDAPTMENYSVDWFGLLCLLVFLAATAVVGFKTAKRMRVD